jgi:hypothetical protein
MKVATLRRAEGVGVELSFRSLLTNEDMAETPQWHCVPHCFLVLPTKAECQFALHPSAR